MNRYDRMIKRHRKALFYAWLGQAIIVLLALGLMFFVINAALQVAADRPCQTATPAYAAELGCNNGR